MRHANSKMTLDTYAQSTTSEKRDAQSRLIHQVIPQTVSLSTPSLMLVQ
jgi:hypothetical protein